MDKHSIFKKLVEDVLGEIKEVSEKEFCLVFYENKQTDSSSLGMIGGTSPFGLSHIIAKIIDGFLANSPYKNDSNKCEKIAKEILEVAGHFYNAIQLQKKEDHKNAKN